MKAFTLTLAFIISFTLFSQEDEIKRTDLYTNGKLAYEANKYTVAALNLFAFYEINKAYFENHDKNLRDNVLSALNFSKSKLISFKTFGVNMVKNGKGEIIIEGKTGTPEHENIIEFNGKEFQVNQLQLIEFGKDGGGV